MTPQDGREEIEAEIARLARRAFVCEVLTFGLRGEDRKTARRLRSHFRAEAAALRRQLDSMGEKK